MSFYDFILENPLVYSFWSRPFVGPKLDAISKVLPEIKGKNFLDVACGPATNTFFFKDCKYTGVDINPKYITVAKRKFHNEQFLVQDACALNLTDRYDVILINSLLHHLNDPAAKNLFVGLKAILNSGGKVIILEPLIPNPTEKMKLLMMQYDRGKFFRAYHDYVRLFDKHFNVEQEHVFDLKLFGLSSWTTLVMRLGKR